MKLMYINDKFQIIKFFSLRERIYILQFYVIETKSTNVLIFEVLNRPISYLLMSLITTC